MSLFDQISVDLTTGAISYPRLDGFELDMDRAYREFLNFLPHSSDGEIAMRHAIHAQIAAHKGAAELRAMAR